MNIQFRKKIKNKNSAAPTLHLYGQTDVGKVRDNNEDFFEVIEPGNAPGCIDGIMVVADGMGGHAAGEVASKMAVEGILKSITSRDEHDTLPAGGYSKTLGQMLNQVNRDVHQASQEPGKQGMGTTCTVAVVKNSKLHIAHVGDSRAYIYRDGNLVQITKDHGWVAEQVEAGNLTEEQAVDHPYRNVVTRAIGTEQEVISDTCVEDLFDRDRIILCSDGLHSVVKDKEIEAIISQGSIQVVCDQLIELANSNGGPDNITVTVAEIHGAVSKKSGKEIDTVNGELNRTDNVKRNTFLKMIFRLIRRK